jgi:hypothetical protein
MSTIAMSSATFTCFPDLPKELRHQIWAEASNLPQLTILEFATNGEGDYEFEFTEIPNSGLFAILQVCSESERLLLKRIDRLSPHRIVSIMSFAPLDF